MEYHSTLINFIESKVSISDMEKEMLRSSFDTCQKSKNDYLIKAGDRARQLFFVVDGIVRLFKYDDKGNEITTNLFRANSFVTSFDSFMNGSTSAESVQCIVDCEFLTISKEKYDSLFVIVEEWPTFYKKIHDEHIIGAYNRTYSFQHLSAAERYQKLVETEPDIVLHTEVKYIASYLGIKPQSLSRIRSSIK